MAKFALVALVSILLVVLALALANGKASSFF